MSEQIQHNCGIVTVVDLAQRRDVTEIAIKIANGLQHRGELGTGLAAYRNTGTDTRFDFIKGPGLVKNVLTPERLAAAGIHSHLVSIHDRYATNGCLDDRMLQPFHTPHEDPDLEFIMTYNGQLAEYEKLQSELRARGLIPEVPGDTEIIRLATVAALQDFYQQGMKNVLNALGVLDGAYNLIYAMGNQNVFALRDAAGFHPLVYARFESMVAIASENSAIHDVWPRAEIHDIEPGQMLEVNMSTKEVRVHQLWLRQKARCFFEWLYFADQGTIIDGASVSAARYRAGKILAQIDGGLCEDSEKGIVVPVPESAKTVCNGYSNESGLPRIDALIKNPLVGRTFTRPGDYLEQAEKKYKIRTEYVKGRVIYLIDDSMVRGNTMRTLVKQLRESGAKEIHLRIAAPPIISPCFYAIDFPTVTELIARKYSDGVFQQDGTLPPDVLKAIAEDVGADSVIFLPRDMLDDVIGVPDGGLCKACITKEYPTIGGQEMAKFSEANSKLVVLNQDVTSSSSTKFQ